MSLKGKIVFDSTNTADSDNIGAFLRSDDGTLITHTNVGGKDGLDVFIVNSTFVISATDLDIRDLSHTQDSIKVGDGTDFLEINADGSINSVVTGSVAVVGNVNVTQGTSPWVVGDGGGSLTVDAVNLDIRDLVYTQDSVTAYQGGSPWSISATDLDIRDLSHTQDSIKIGDGTDFLAINADGSINVNADISVVNGSDKAEDAVHASGDIGTYVLNVREDSLSSSTSASGDYQSFKSDALGRLYVNRSGQSAAYGTTSIAATATDIVGTDLSNRSRILVQNVSNKAVYLGSNASVTTANGIRLDPGAAIEMDAGAAINLHAITASGTADVRYFEIA